MQICPFLCLPKNIYFHFDHIEWNLAFSDANVLDAFPGEVLPTKSFDLKMSEFDPMGGASAF